jgi:hypothetical protein
MAPFLIDLLKQVKMSVGVRRFMVPVSGGVQELDGDVSQSREIGHIERGRQGRTGDHFRHEHKRVDDDITLISGLVKNRNLNRNLRPLAHAACP